MYQHTHTEQYYAVSEGKYTKGLGQLQLSFATQAEDPNSLALTGNLSLTQPSTIYSKTTTFTPRRWDAWKLEHKVLLIKANLPKQS